MTHPSRCPGAAVLPAEFPTAEIGGCAAPSMPTASAAPSPGEAGQDPPTSPTPLATAPCPPLPGTLWRSFVAGFRSNHPIFVGCLGICSALAVTGQVRHALVMALAVTGTTALAGMIISTLRQRLPTSFRLIAFMLVISTVVIVVDRLLRIWMPAVARELGPYVGLIITNCIVLGRIETFASRRPVLRTVVDAAGAGFGYGTVLLLVAAVRESLGLGTVAGIRVMPSGYQHCSLLMTPAGAFLVLAGLLVAANVLRRRQGPAGSAAGDSGLTQVGRRLLMLGVIFAWCMLGAVGFTSSPSPTTADQVATEASGSMPRAAETGDDEPIPPAGDGILPPDLAPLPTLLMVIPSPLPLSTLIGTFTEGSGILPPGIGQGPLLEATSPAPPGAAPPSLWMILLAAMLTNNIALTCFLGMCPLLALSRERRTAVGMGLAVTVVGTVTAAVNWWIDRLALTALRLEFLQFLVFIIVIAALVQWLELLIDRFFPALYRNFGLYLPLLVVNCVILAISLLMTIRQYDLPQTLMFALGTGLGWAGAIWLLSGLRAQLIHSRVPRALGEVGAALLLAGLMAMAFGGFSGMARL